MNLLKFFKADNYEEFCLNYSNDIIPIMQLHEEVEKNIPYLKFILHRQQTNYEMLYIEYLARHKKSDVIIDFFSSIKDIEDKGAVHNCDELLKIICLNKDIQLFSYISTHHIPHLLKFDYQANLFNIFWREDFVEGVDLVSQRLPNSPIRLIDNILNANLHLKSDQILNVNLNFSFINNPEKLREILLNYYYSDEVKKHRDILQAYKGDDREEIFNMGLSTILHTRFPSLPFMGSNNSTEKLNALKSKEKLLVNFKTDNISKILWTQYSLQLKLKEKPLKYEEIKI